MLSIEYKAPVSVILCGEEGIPYGKPAVGCAIDAWVSAKIQPAQTAPKGKYTTQIAHEIFARVGKKVADIPAVGVVYPDKVPPNFEGRVSAEIVATTAVLFHYFVKKPAAPEMINNCAFRVLKSINKDSLGLHNSISTFGGLIYFRKEFEFLKGIYKLPYKITPQIEKDMRISFQYPKENISTLYKKSPRKAEELLAAQEKATKRLVVAIIKKDYELFFAQCPSLQNGFYKLKQSFLGVHS